MIIELIFAVKKIWKSISSVTGDSRISAQQKQKLCLNCLHSNIFLKKVTAYLLQACKKSSAVTT